MKNFLLTCLIVCSVTLILQAQNTTTFNFTGEVQVYTVPSCVTSLDITMAGAKGGGLNGGQGSSITATIDVIPGQVLEIYVGGMGSCPAGGFNGGGNGAAAQGVGNESCGGGGATDIRISPFSLGDRILVAAGGGGMGGGDTDALAGNSGCGLGGDGDSPFGQGGFGATTVQGGLGGPPWITDGNSGENGSLGIGGSGATDPCFDLGPGGGGGGGYYGGGGGGSDCWATPALGGGGGGGGSSFFPAGAICTDANNSSDGYVTITTLGGMNLTIEPTNPSICEGESVEISVNGGLTYSWSPSESLNIDTGNVVIASPLSTQTYSIAANDGQGCLDTLEIEVLVTPYPTITVNPSSPSICEGENIELTASGAATYLWSPATGLSSTNSPTVSANPAFTQTYTVTGSTLGCSSDTTFTLLVNENPVISVVPQNSIICPGESVDLTADGAQNYIWSPSAGLSSTTGATVSAGPLNTITYLVTGTASNGCTDTTTVTVNVSDLPDVDAGEDQTICNGTSAQLIGLSTVAISYTWSPTESLSNSTIQNPIASPTSTTTYTLTVTDINGCTNTDEVTVFVNTVEASFTATPETGFAPISISFDNNSSSNATFFQWDFGDGTFVVNNSPTIDQLYEQNGTYNVYLIATDANGCTDTTSIQLLLQEPFSLTIPNVFTPNGDGMNDSFQPQVRGVKSFDVSIYNRWGVLVYEYSGANGKWDGTKNGVKSSDGVYFYVINLTTTSDENQSHEGTITLLN